MTDALEAFLASQPFTPDAFQIASLESIANGRSVVVTAPTGAGKTLVADGAIALVSATGERAFYTTPIKALSNQKFNDLIAVHGPENVGLLTGDRVINGDAPIVVMTTEVLRNMIYEGSHALEHLGVVVLDEVHYLADRHRGSVWEEVIIHLDRSIPLVCLSATIANAEEFTSWILARRGPTDLIVETERPVPLTPMYMWNDRHDGSSTHFAPIFARNGRPNTQVSRILAKGRGRRQRFGTPRRVEVASALAEEGLLPAIMFIFSRKGCDAAAGQLARANLGFTNREERALIRGIAERHTAHLGAEDLVVLGYDSWLTNLEQGVGAHHAGLVPAFKETVEELFLEGLLKVVAATETLALGINMPARTVVLESLSKFTGETHELLQPSDFTQLTGRAGRRGIDTTGTAVVLHSSYVPFDRVAGIAAAGSNPLRSSFAPTYNMTVNLIARYDAAAAHELLRASFANFSDQERTRQLEQNLEDRRSDLATFRNAAECEKGDVWELLEDSAPGDKHVPNLGMLHPGTVLEFSRQRWVLLGRSWGGQDPRLRLTDEHGVPTRMKASAVPKGSVVLGRISLPTPVRASDPVFCREVASLLGGFVPSDDAEMLYQGERGSAIETCPDLDTHLQWAERARRTERDLRRLERRLERRTTHDVVKDFDRLHTALDSLGYTNGWAVTEEGESLRRLYNELDLPLAECLSDTTLTGHSPAEFAALVSVFTYQTRGGDAPQQPTAEFAHRPLQAINGHWERIAELEEEAGLTPTREPDLGLVDTLHGWATGLDLDEIFNEEDLRAGDFVRSCRQVLDLLRQIRDGFPAHRSVAARAIEAVDRGIVQVDV